jgi:hypothetical protein
VEMVNLKINKNVGGCGCVAVPPPPRTSCRPRRLVWRGWRIAPEPIMRMHNVLKPVPIQRSQACSNPGYISDTLLNLLLYCEYHQINSSDSVSHCCKSLSNIPDVKELHIDRVYIQFIPVIES